MDIEFKDFFRDILIATHEGIAILASTPEISLSLDEADKLAKAGLNVSRHYMTVGVDPVMRDWVMLAYTAAMVYGPRVMAARMNAAERRAKAPEAPKPQPQQPAPRPQGGEMRKIIDPLLGEMEIPGMQS